MRTLAISAIVIAIAAAGPAASKPRSSLPAIHTLLSVVSDGHREPDGSTWFKTWSEGARFVLPANDDPSTEKLWNVLLVSSSDSRAIEIGFDAAGANFNTDTGTIDFPVCSARLDDIIFTRSPACAAKQMDAERLSSPAKAALGWAEVANGSPAAALPLLDNAIADPKLPQPLQVIALIARSSANSQVAYRARPTSEDSDRAFVAALIDDRRLAELQPTDVEHRFSEAADLFALGDYDGASRLYDEILKLWPDETYRVTVRRAALARTLGQNEHSLELLNSLVPGSAGEDLGMKFYYHRGWTLMKLDRFDEAIADFTEGLKSQPDWQWAYILRGCSYASMGQIEYGSGDFAVAAHFLEALPSARSSARVQHDAALANSIAQSLKKRAEAGETSPVMNLCDGFWDQLDNGRPRSALLDAGAARPAG